jgi:hypothetical protein
MRTMPRLNWLRFRRASQDDGAKLLQGSIELISPSLLSGWVFHPLDQLCEVRLVSGTRLIASSPIDVARPDVCVHLGRSGNLGFNLALPESFPDPEPSERLSVLALNADGSCRHGLYQLGSTPGATEARLRAALAPAMRGLRGHFDGLSPDGRELQGWCYSPNGGVATVWLHAEGGGAPRALRCSVHRPGMEAQGHLDNCGFVLPLHDWAEAAGRLVWASFDEAGELRLPQLESLRLPQMEPSVSPTLFTQLIPAGTEMPNVFAPPPIAEIPMEFQAHWQALDDFRNLIDRLELQVHQDEQAAYSEILEASPEKTSLPKRRSARFRLWR